MKRILRTAALSLLIIILARPVFSQQITYGFIQSPTDPFLITAVAYPDFTSANVDISTAVFTFLLPEGTTTNPSVTPLPSTGAFTNITGSWTVQLLTPTVWGSVGLDPATLEGKDVYQVSFNPSSATTLSLTSGTPLQLFRFRLPLDCFGGFLEVLVNNSAIQQAVLDTLGANFNNQMSLSIDDGASIDRYSGNNPSSDSLECPLNDPPVARRDNASLNEDAFTTLDLSANDTDENGNLDATSVDTACARCSGPSDGTLTIHGDGSVTYTPDANFYGSDTIIYQICDDASECDTALVVFTVNPVNDGPIVDNENVVIDEDTPATGDLTDAGDTDIDGNLVANTSPVLAPLHGDIIVNTDGTYTYTPDSNYNGFDTVVVQICDDGTGSPGILCVYDTIFLTINPVNDPPVAVNDLNNTLLNVTVSGDVLTNDSDPEGDALSVGSTPLQDVQHGVLTLNTDGTYSYAPDPGFYGEDSALYQVCDAGGLCDSAWLYLTVINTSTLANRAPVANEDAYEGLQDLDVIGNVLGNDFDPDGDGLTLTLVSGPAQGALDVFNTSTGAFTYNPTADFIGTDQFVYSLCDDGTPSLCDTTIVTIDIAPYLEQNVTDAVDDAFLVEEDAAAFSGSVALNDHDAEGNTQSFTLLDSTQNGELLFTPSTGAFTYNSNDHYYGTDQFTYLVCDDGTPQACDTATAYITVLPVNDPPLALPDQATTPEDVAVSLNWAVNDNDPQDPDGGIDNTSITITRAPSHGTITIDTAAGTMEYTPGQDYVGTDTLIYEICDDGYPLPAECDTALVVFTMTAVNDAPVVDNEYETINEDNSATGDLTDAGDSDVDGNLVVNTTPVAPPLNGNIVVNANGSYTYTPDDDFYGNDTVVVQICDDGTGAPGILCVYDTIFIVVNPVNDDPVARRDQALTNENVAVVIPVLANDTDVDGTPDPATLDTTGLLQPSHGTLTINNLTGVITYTPDAYFFGADSFDYIVCDDGFPVPVLCDTSRVFITVSERYVRLSPRMLLQGALIGTNDTLMQDSLRSRGYIPSTEPYSALADSFVHVSGGGGETIADPVSVFGVTGHDAIVDWVFVELRAASKPDSVVATRAGLVQRDGDVVDTDGSSPLLFGQSLAGSYYVAVRHRNHLGTMTGQAISLTSEGTLVDFTDVNLNLWTEHALFAGVEQRTFTAQSVTRKALWAGNANMEDKVVFAGQDNDVDAIFNAIDGAPGNAFFHLQNYVLSGYHASDVDMNGDAIYSGQDNDVDHIFNNVDGHPKNILKQRVFVIREQLAK